jgi:hypothetical protein
MSRWRASFERADSFWNSARSGTALILVFLALAVFYYFNTPSPGKSVAALAVAASLMTFRKEPSGLEKFFWMGVLFVFLFIEVRSIDNYEVDSKKSFLDATARQEADFGKVLKQNHDEFEATMARSGMIQTKTEQAADLAKDSLENITGGGSVPCVVPQTHAVVNGVIPLVVWNRGKKNSLTGLELKVLAESEFLDQRSLFYKPSAEPGTLHPSWAKPIPTGITPQVDSNGVAHYIIEIWAQNGFYTEVLNFRRGKYDLPWAYQYWLTKQPGAMASPSKPIRQTVDTKCYSPQWSDDLGDGKPVKHPSQ